jgi:hypothetical protein
MAHHLAALLRTEATLPTLVLHALSTGFRVDQPHIAPVAFFSLFDALSPKVGYVGLFAPAIVSSQHYDAVKREPGVAESFAAAGDIDVILTSLASASDEHGALNQFLADHAGDVEGLKQAGWIGDLRHCGGRSVWGMWSHPHRCPLPPLDRALPQGVDASGRRLYHRSGTGGPGALSLNPGAHWHTFALPFL